jgi:hypothetical protein
MTDVVLTTGVASAVAAADALDALKKEKPARRAVVTEATFLDALARASRQNPPLTAAQLAADLNMEKASLDQRLVNMRKQWKALQAKGVIPAVNEKGEPQPFPFVLTDGRTLRGGNVEPGTRTQNAILAALGKVDATSAPAETAE